MMRSRSGISFVLLFLVSMFVAFGTTCSVAYADTKYIVNKGDTLFGIASTYHTSVAAIMRENGLHTTLIQIDQPLWIPTVSRPSSATRRSVPPNKDSFAVGVYHKPMFAVVRPGDTLWQIAMYNHTSVHSLMSVNHLNSSLIFPGQRLMVNPTETRRNFVFAGGQQGLLHSVNLSAARENGIPLSLIPVYQGAGQKYGIPWTVLAAIHRTETDFSTQPEVSSAGAEGPMQFMPATFQRYAVTAPGCQGAPDINNLDDAIYTAAHMLAANGFARNPSAALYQYNHSMAYVDAVETLAHTYQ